MSATNVTVRAATRADTLAIGRLLHDFNTEYLEITPGPAKLAERIAELMEAGDTEVLLAGDEPLGLAVLRFRLAIWSTGTECCLAELYVVPDRRGQGLGARALRAHGVHQPRRQAGRPGHVRLRARPLRTPTARRSGPSIKPGSREQERS